MAINLSLIKRKDDPRPRRKLLLPEFGMERPESVYGGNSAMTMILRGRKLQEALLLAAEGQLSDFQIAKHLGVSARHLEATRELAFFEKRVAEIQRTVAIVRAKQKKTVSK